MTFPQFRESLQSWEQARLANFAEKSKLLFKQVQEIEGVQNAFVVDQRGMALSALGEKNLDWNFYDLAGRLVTDMFDPTDKRGRRANEIEFRFKRRGLYARNLGNAFAIIICAPNTNWSLLRMGLNVVAASIEQDADLQKSLSGSAN